MHGQTKSLAKASAIQLRKQMTDAERALWHRLRHKQLGVKFRRQHPFEKYVLDFVYVERKLVIEVDGSQHLERVAEDTQRTSDLEKAGFRLLRFWNNEVLTEIEGVLERILTELNGASAVVQTHPHPNPPPEGEGDTG